LLVLEVFGEISKMDDPEKIIIGDLLSALATTTKCASKIPVNGKIDKNNEVDAGEFTFNCSFPEFQTLTNTARGRVNDLISRSMNVSLGDVADGVNDEWGDEVDDPELWESCADACEALLERVNAIVDGNFDVGGDGRLREKETLLNGVASLARQTAAQKLAQLTSNHVDMEKVRGRKGASEAGAGRVVS